MPMVQIKTNPLSHGGTCGL